MALVKVYFRTKWHLHPFSRLATHRHGPKIGWGAVPFFLGGSSWVSIKHKVAWAEAYLRNKWHLDPFSHLATIAESPSNTMWPGPRPTCMPSFIWSHPTVWPGYILRNFYNCTTIPSSPFLLLPFPPSQRGTAHPNFRPISLVAKWLNGSRCHLVGR